MHIVIKIETLAIECIFRWSWAPKDQGKQSADRCCREVRIVLRAPCLTFSFNSTPFPLGPTSEGPLGIESKNQACLLKFPSKKIFRCTFAGVAYSAVQKVLFAKVPPALHFKVFTRKMRFCPASLMISHMHPSPLVCNTKHFNSVVFRFKIANTSCPQKWV